VKSAASICGTSPPDADAGDDVVSDESLLHAANTSENATKAPTATNDPRTDPMRDPSPAVSITLCPFPVSRRRAWDASRTRSCGEGVPRTEAGVEDEVRELAPGYDRPDLRRSTSTGDRLSPATSVDAVPR
jgi:hypothetical protein